MKPVHIARLVCKPIDADLTCQRHQHAGARPLDTAPNPIRPGHDDRTLSLRTKLHVRLQLPN